MVEAVLFDVGNTLLTPNPSVAQTFIEVAARFGYTLTEQQVQAHIPEMDNYYEQLYSEDDSFWCSSDRATMIWVEMYKLLCYGVGIYEDAERVSRAVHAEYGKPERWRVFDDVLPCLDSLSAMGVFMGLISNWDDSLVGVIDGMGLSKYFGTVISSADVGLRKPDAAIFKLAADRLGVCVSDCLYVGDHLYADVMGSRDAGMHPVLLARDGAVIPGKIDAERTLEKIPQRVARLRAS